MVFSKKLRIFQIFLPTGVQTAPLRTICALTLRKMTVKIKKTYAALPSRDTAYGLYRLRSSDMYPDLFMKGTVASCIMPCPSSNARSNTVCPAVRAFSPEISKIIGFF